MRTLLWRTVPIALLVVSVMGGLVARAQEQKPIQSPGDHSRPIMVAPGDLTWVDGPPVLPPGAKMAAIKGDLKGPGPFTVRLKFPAGYTIPAHWHSAEAYVTVISGSFNMGLGDKLDPAKGKVLPVGSFAVMPARIHHFGWATEETIIQQHGTGPWGIHYVDPADDPRKKQ